VQSHTDLYEIIEKDFLGTGAVEFGNQQIHKRILEPVPECGEGSFQLMPINGSGIISIKTPEALLPIVDVFPQSREFVKRHSAGMILLNNELL
jgi:hypothetical protein